jgi:hypothetical protein
MSYDDSYGGLSQPWPARVAIRWGHWGAQILVASIVGAIVLVLRPPPPGNPLALEGPIALCFFVLASWGFMRQHDRRLCEPCMATLPLNASEMAVNYRRRLAVAHLGANLPITVAYLAVLIGSSPVLLDTTLLPHALAGYVWAAIQSTMIYLVLSYTTHRRLQPWCPQCSGGDGGREDVDAPDPVPTGSHTA